MHRQLAIISRPRHATGHPALAPVAPRSAAPAVPPEAAWHDDSSWRFGPAHRIEYRYPQPTSPSPLAVQGADWQWNPLVPGWRLHYARPPFSLAPSGETTDRHGPKLLPPARFFPIDQARLCGRCPHCRAHGTRYWGAAGWGGWADPRIAAAYEAELASGRPCNGVTEIEVPGIGPVQPMSHYTRWRAGFCSACGAVSWNDFRSPEGAYYRPPSRAGALSR